jgi:hypothetical protein
MELERSLPRLQKASSVPYPEARTIQFIPPHPGNSLETCIVITNSEMHIQEFVYYHWTTKYLRRRRKKKLGTSNTKCNTVRVFELHAVFLTIGINIYRLTLLYA